MKLATIEVIKELKPHGNADRLELARVCGWQCVVKKGEFEEGARIVFIAIDTLLEPASWNSFLASKDKPESRIRLKTVRLRGEYSQGLILPLGILPEEFQAEPEGTEVGELLGVTKYEKEVPAHLAGIALGPFPAHICASTDEENGLSNEDLVKEVLGGPLTVTRKLDGSSCTVIVRDGVITHVCSRRLHLKEDEKNSFWKAAKKLSLPLPNETGVGGVGGVGGGGTISIQGELMGPGVQGNQLGLSDHQIFVFQVRIGDRFLPYDEMVEFCRDQLNCETVPKVTEIDSGAELDGLQELADQQFLPGGEAAEGIVVRRRDYQSGGSGRPLGFKLINRNFRD
jgi:RNA ligase (TIGR02306 family)